MLRISRVDHVCPDGASPVFIDIKAGIVNVIYDPDWGPDPEVQYCPRCGEKLPATLSAIWDALVSQLPDKVQEAKIDKEVTA